MKYLTTVADSVGRSRNVSVLGMEFRQLSGYLHVWQTYKLNPFCFPVSVVLTFSETKTLYPRGRFIKT